MTTPPQAVLDELHLVQQAIGQFPWGPHSGFQEGAPGLGSGAPNEYDIHSLLHEVGHIAQLADHEIQRVYPNGYGFHVPGIWLFGKFYTQPTTTRITEREAEVIAIQTVIAEHVLGTERDSHLDYWVSCCQYLPDFIYVPVERAGESETLAALDAKRFAWIRTRVEFHLERWPMDRICERFRLNMQRIQEHLVQLDASYA